MTLRYKKRLSQMGDNPNYMEIQIKAIEKELTKDRPNTDYLQEKIDKMTKWLREIKIANYQTVTVGKPNIKEINKQIDKEIRLDNVKDWL